MTRRSIMEYVQALRSRYSRASKEEKGKILDEFAEVTGLDRKAAIRLLHRRSQVRASKRHGRPWVYRRDLIPPLRAIWEASNRLCSKRFKPFLPEMVRVLRQHSEHMINASTEARLCQMSPSKIDRLLRPYRKVADRKSRSTIRPGNSLENSITIRTFNGSEFINQCFYKYCRGENITFARSHSYKKDDSCHAEQKNGNVVHRLVVYDRYTPAASECLDRLYHCVPRYTNFLQPAKKLMDRTRNGAKVYKVQTGSRLPTRVCCNWAS